MTDRNQSDTPGFDAHVLNAVGEGGDDQGGQQQPMQPSDSGDNKQPTQAPQQQQPSGVDDAIARTERVDTVVPPTDPNKPQPKPQPKPSGQGRMVDENGVDVPTAARHHFLSRKKAEKDLRAVQGQLHEANGKLQAFQSVHQVMQQSGLSPQEQATSMALGAALKKNPVEAVKQLLTELKSAGINVDGAMNVSGIDTDAIARLIDAKLAPITQRDKSEREQAEHEAGIAEDVASFFDEEPDARIHAAELNVILQRNPNWSLDKAWAEYRVGFAKNGLDLSQPLRPQIAARRVNTSPANGRVPMISNGRGGAQPLPVTQTKSYDHNANTRDMVRDALREAGVDVSRL